MTKWPVLPSAVSLTFCQPSSDPSFLPLDSRGSGHCVGAGYVLHLKENQSSSSSAYMDFAMEIISLVTALAPLVTISALTKSMARLALNSTERDLCTLEKAG